MNWLDDKRDQLSKWIYAEWQDGVLLRGDSLEIMPLLKPIDSIITDIPYGISQQSNGLRSLDYGEWDHLNNMELVWMEAMLRMIASTAIIFCGKEQISNLISYAKEKKLITKILIWHKPNPTVLNCQHHYIDATEFAIYTKNLVHSSSQVINIMFLSILWYTLRKGIIRQKNPHN